MNGCHRSRRDGPAREGHREGVPVSRGRGDATARPLGALGLEESRHFERLQRAGVVRKGPPGAWYLDETAWTERMLKRRRIGLVLLVVALFALALGLGLIPATRP